jgi:hypothetical protein
MTKERRKANKRKRRRERLLNKNDENDVCAL